MLSAELNEQDADSEVRFDRQFSGKQTLSIAHGLWQWPSRQANELFLGKGILYLLFPHGMLDPWFKQKYPLKHIKKQIYWWLKQGKILNQALAVCYTTEEERRLAQSTFGLTVVRSKSRVLAFVSRLIRFLRKRFYSKRFPN